MIRLFKRDCAGRTAAVVAAVFIVSLAAYAFSNHGRRRIFYFPRFEGKSVSVESRNLPSKPVQGKVALFVDELLLGPETERCRPLFSPGTHREFCFVRGKTLFVGLSKDVLYDTAPAADIKKGTELFKKNILKNFAYIKSVELFVDGKPVYEDNKKS